MRKLFLVLLLISNFSIAADAPQPMSGMNGGLKETLPGMQKTPTDTAVAQPKAAGIADYKKFRDPFKEPVYVESMEVRSELERFSVTDFKVTGIITGPIRMRAMILAPDGKTHYVAEKMKLGMRDGVIVKITTKTIVVREKVVNPLGEVELFDTEIGLEQANNAASSGY